MCINGNSLSMPEYLLQDSDLLPKKEEAIISSIFSFLAISQMGEKLLLLLLSRLRVTLQKLFLPLSMNLYLLSPGRMGWSRHPITSPVLAPYTSIVIVLRFPISRN